MCTIETCISETRHFSVFKAQSAEENTVKKLKDADKETDGKMEEETDGKMEEELTDN